MDRKSFLKDALGYLLDKGLSLVDEEKWIQAAEKKLQKKQRPPGAKKSEEAFLKACIGCDACMKACPHDLIFIEKQDIRDPLIYPEQKPCVKCLDYPCIASCPTGALCIEEDKEPRDVF